MEKGISVIILAYKEEENLRILLPKVNIQLKKLGVNYQIIVVDTAEPMDDTRSVCAENGCEYINQKEPYFGGALRTGINAAKKELLLTLDGDGAHNPIYIPDIYKKFIEDECDVVIGSRYTKNGGTNDSISSVFMSHLLNYTYRICLGIHAKDISTNYRMYYTKDLQEIDLVRHNYDVLQEVLMKLKLNIRAKQRKIKIEEIPIVLDKREYGKSKRKLFVFIIDYIKTLIWLTSLRFKSDKEKKDVY